MKHKVTCDTSQPGYTRLGSGQASSLTRHLFDRNKVFCVWHTDFGATIQSQLDTIQVKIKEIQMKQHLSMGIYFIGV